MKVLNLKNYIDEQISCQRIRNNKNLISIVLKDGCIMTEDDKSGLFISEIKTDTTYINYNNTLIVLGNFTFNGNGFARDLMDYLDKHNNFKVVIMLNNDCNHCIEVVRMYGFNLIINEFLRKNDIRFYTNMKPLDTQSKIKYYNFNKHDIGLYYEYHDNKIHVSISANGCIKICINHNFNRGIMYNEHCSDKVFDLFDTFVTEINKNRFIKVAGEKEIYDFVKKFIEEGELKC